MIMAVPQRHRLPYFAYFGLASVALLVLLPAVSAGASQPEERTTLDCGVNSLYILLHLEGRQATLDRVESVLPPRHRDGFSMAELSAAAGSLGLGLEGVQFAKGDKALDRPAIVFTEDSKGGH